MGSGLGFGAYGGTGGSSRRERLLFSATNKRLKNAIDQMYRPGALVGDGGLADAIRYEKVTGESVGGRSHFLNSTFALSGLERGGLGSAAKPVRPSGQAGRRCAPVAGVEFLRIGRLEWT